MHDSVTLTIGIAALAGTLALVIARRLGIPGILLLLATGAALGRSGVGLVEPATLGKGLNVFVEFAVAIILFEGALSLRPKHFMANAGPIRNLVTAGAVVTFFGATLVVRLALGFPLAHAALVGAILIVTGPTVVTPLIGFIRPKPQLGEILRWEAILIDPIGALVAVVLLEAVLVGGDHAVASAAHAYGECFALGTAVGVAAGLLFEKLLGAKTLVDEELRSPLAIAIAIGSYAVAQELRESSGLFAVTAAGLTCAVRQPPGLEEIERFKGRLTSFVLAILFVLLAGLMDLNAVARVGSRIVPFLGGLFLVRLACVSISTIGSGLSWREKLFLGWISPRGVVAAASASLFAQKLVEHGDPTGDEIRTAIFCVIVGTVVLQGLTSRTIARWLGVAAPEPNEVVLVGAGPFGRALAKELATAGAFVTVVDKNPLKVMSLNGPGIRTISGDAQDRAALEQYEASRIAFLVAATPNDEANALVCTAFASILGHARVTQLPSGSTALLKGERFAATQYPFAFGSGTTLDMLERALLKGGRVVTLRGGAVAGLAEGESFLPLFAVGAGGVPRLIRDRAEPVDPEAQVIGVATDPAALRESTQAEAPPPPRKAHVEVVVAVGVALAAALPQLPWHAPGAHALASERSVASATSSSVASATRGTIAAPTSAAATPLPAPSPGAPTLATTVLEAERDLAGGDPRATAGFAAALAALLGVLAFALARRAGASAAGALAAGVLAALATAGAPADAFALQETLLAGALALGAALLAAWPLRVAGRIAASAGAAGLFFLAVALDPRALALAPIALVAGAAPRPDGPSPGRRARDAALAFGTFALGAAAAVGLALSRGVVLAPPAWEVPGLDGLARAIAVGLGASAPDVLGVVAWAPLALGGGVLVALALASALGVAPARAGALLVLLGGAGAAALPGAPGPARLLPALGLALVGAGLVGRLERSSRVLGGILAGVLVAAGVACAMMVALATGA